MSDFDKETDAVEAAKKKFFDQIWERAEARLTPSQYLSVIESSDPEFIAYAQSNGPHWVTYSPNSTVPGWALLAESILAEKELTSLCAHSTSISYLHNLKTKIRAQGKPNKTIHVLITQDGDAEFLSQVRIFQSLFPKNRIIAVVSKSVNDNAVRMSDLATGFRCLVEIVLAPLTDLLNPSLADAPASENGEAAKPGESNGFSLALVKAVTQISKSNCAQLTRIKLSIVELLSAANGKAGNLDSLQDRTRRLIRSSLESLLKVYKPALYDWAEQNALVGHVLFALQRATTGDLKGHARSIGAMSGEAMPQVFHDAIDDSDFKYWFRSLAEHLSFEDPDALVEPHQESSNVLNKLVQKIVVALEEMETQPKTALRSVSIQFPKEAPTLDDGDLNLRSLFAVRNHVIEAVNNLCEIEINGLESNKVITLGRRTILLGFLLSRSSTQGLRERFDSRCQSFQVQNSELDALESSCETVKARVEFQKTREDAAHAKHKQIFDVFKDSVAAAEKCQVFFIDALNLQRANTEKLGLILNGAYEKTSMQSLLNEHSLAVSDINQMDSIVENAFSKGGLAIGLKPILDALATIEEIVSAPIELPKNWAQFTNKPMNWREAAAVNTLLEKAVQTSRTNRISIRWPKFEEPSDQTQLMTKISMFLNKLISSLQSNSLALFDGRIEILRLHAALFAQELAQVALVAFNASNVAEQKKSAAEKSMPDVHLSNWKPRKLLVDISKLEKKDPAITKGELALMEALVMEQEGNLEAARKKFADISETVDATVDAVIWSRAHYGALRCSIAQRGKPVAAALSSVMALIDLQDMRSSESQVFKSKSGQRRVFPSFRSSIRSNVLELSKKLTDPISPIQFLIDAEREMYEDFDPVIYHRLMFADYIIVFLTSDYFSSPWCVTELTVSLQQAKFRGTKLFWIYVDHNFDAKPSGVKAMVLQRLAGDAPVGLTSQDVTFRRDRLERLLELGHPLTPSHMHADNLIELANDINVQITST